MLLSLLRCFACDLPPSPEHFPLCEVCARSLVSSPDLCSQCGSPACLRENQCLRPWAASPFIRSYSAAYLLLEPGYTVLKKWKIRRGPLLDRQILKPERLTSETRARLKGAQAIVPIPQRTFRSWRLGGSPALRIAEWLAQETGIPILSALEAPLLPGKSRQGELRSTERFSNRLTFGVNQEELARLRAKEIILVDDFMTSGHTIRHAAHLLRDWGADGVHVFCLGIRLFRSGGQKLAEGKTHLSHAG